MADNKEIVDGRDSSKIDAEDRNELEHLHLKYPKFSIQQIKDAIEKYGPDREHVEAMLSK